jgi:hypothetical protein
MQGIGARQQVESLKNEAEFAKPDVCQRVIVELRNIDAIERIRAARRSVEAADEIHQRRFARARRPHDRDVLALHCGQRDAAKYGDLE